MELSKHGRGRAALALAFATTTALALAAPVSAAVTGTTNGNTVATALSTVAATGTLSAPIGLTQAGTGNTALAGFPTAGSTYGLLTSGDSQLADDPNLSESDGDDLGNSDPARGDAFDPITLRVNFTVPAGNSCLLLDYRFASEEFPEFVNQGFNDGFIAELDGTNWSTANQAINAPLDFAAGYGTKISVDAVGPTAVSAANAAGTTYDGATTILTTKTPVTPGAHSVYLSVFDAGDGIYDSAAFLDGLRFNAETPATCKAPDIFQGDTGIDPVAGSGPIKFKGSTGTLMLACTLPAGATDPCVGTVDLATFTALAADASAVSAKKKKKKKLIRVAAGSYSIPPATTGAVRLTLTKGGRALLKKRGKATATATVTNTVNNTKERFPVKLKGKKKKKKKK